MEPGFALARLAHARRRLLPRRKVDHAGQGARREDGADHEQRQDHRAQTQGFAARPRGDRQHVHEQEGAGSVLREGNRGRPQDRRHVLAARESHHDEGVPPHRVWPLREDLLQGRFRQARRLVRRTGRERQQRHGQPVRQDLHAAAEQAGRDQARPARLPRVPSRTGHGGFRQGHHQLPLAQ